jgi:hypothetical protein
MEISFNTRVTIAFFAGLLGLIWQGVIATTGGDPSEALITAFSTVLLSTIGIGIKTGEANADGNDKTDKS